MYLSRLEVDSSRLTRQSLHNHLSLESSDRVDIIIGRIVGIFLVGLGLIFVHAFIFGDDGEAVQWMVLVVGLAIVGAGGFMALFPDKSKWGNGTGGGD